MTGPGLALDLLEARIEGSTLSITFAIADAEWRPLDRAGMFSAGEVQMSFVAVWLDEDPSGEPLQYTAYTTRPQTSTISGATALQAAAGLELTKGGVRFSPDVPDRMHRLRFRFQHHGRWYRVELESGRLRVSVDDAEPIPVPVEVYGRRYLVEPGAEIDAETRRLTIHHPALAKPL